MKKITLIILVAISAITFGSCGGGTDSKSVAQNWVNAFIKEDYDAAKKLSTPDVVKHLGEMAAIPSSPEAKEKAKKAKITVKDAKEEGDKATVTCTVAEGDGPKSSDLSVILVKQDGKWLVS